MHWRGLKNASRWAPTAFFNIGVLKTVIIIDDDSSSPETVTEDLNPWDAEVIHIEKKCSWKCVKAKQILLCYWRVKNYMKLNKEECLNPRNICPVHKCFLFLAYLSSLSIRFDKIMFE